MAICEGGTLDETGQRVRYLFVMCIAIRRGLASVIVIASVHTLIMNRTIRIFPFVHSSNGFRGRRGNRRLLRTNKKESRRKGVILITGGYAQLESD